MIKSYTGYFFILDISMIKRYVGRLFCAGLTHLANGNVLLTGGTKMYDNDVDNCNGKWHGLNSTYEVDTQSEKTFGYLQWCMVDGIQHWLHYLTERSLSQMVLTNLEVLIDL